MPHPRASPRLWSNVMPSGDKQEPVLKSKTTWASPLASAEPTWPNAPANRLAVSEPRFCSLAGASEASLCAIVCAFVLGGAYPAGQPALHFSRYAETVTILVRDS